ncbi:hypothetical protein [Aliikangiella sp. IMCC44359]|uniref:hypothetical protein n=1 Tax=Aliikangiella sp. IMCC44359 TaxID=3459125 RepID=UPI00403AE6B5
MSILRVLFITVILSITACSDGGSKQAATNREAIFILFENSGTIAEDEQGEATNTLLHLLQQITTLARKRATKHTPVYILFSDRPNQFAWSGTPVQLREQAPAIKDLITFKSSFNDLVMAFEQIETTINLMQTNKARLYWIGSTIHVPFQASAEKIEVEVPQAVPENLALLNFANKLNTLKIYRNHPDQDQILQAYFSANGILKRAKNQKLDFTLLGAAQTKSQLNNLL